MKKTKFAFLFVLLLFLFSCRKSEEISNSIGAARPVMIIPVSLSLKWNGNNPILLKDTLANHLSEFIIEATLSDGSTQNITPTAEILSGFDTSSIGEKIITATVNGKTASTTILVCSPNAPSSPRPISLSLTWDESKPISILRGEDVAVHLNNFIIKETMSDGSVKTITPTSEIFNSFNTSTVGDKSISIILDGLSASTNVMICTPPSEFVFNNGKITDFVGGSTDIVIPKYIHFAKVTSIGDNAFFVNGLASVVIPNSVTSIGAYAFFHNSLKSLTLPDSIATIGMAAFYENQLESLTISDSVTAIGAGAFRSNKLTSVSVPSSVTSIGSTAFYENSNLKSVAISSSFSTTINDFFNIGDITYTYK